MQTSPRNEGLIFPVLAAALLSWSLISLVDLIVFLLIQFTRPKTGKLLCANLYLLISSVCYQCFLMLACGKVEQLGRKVGFGEELRGGNLKT
ncbi:hypothetical protein CK203_071650 [Vitis vinifera]|uniref:Uncharacterized protein n=1 Tax=Vitis vinifera TaxID=29760 RepID=A0A438F4K9_VITVI|nr:hypothetical protein CK203_071650 [Vitis vinifera]